VKICNHKTNFCNHPWAGENRCFGGGGGGTKIHPVRHDVGVRTHWNTYATIASNPLPPPSPTLRSEDGEYDTAHVPSRVNVGGQYRYHFPRR